MTAPQDTSPAVQEAPRLQVQAPIEEPALPAKRHWPRIAAVAVVLVGLCLTWLGARHELNTAQAADQQRFDRLAEQLKAELTRRVMVYDYGLKGTRGLFPASNSVERDEFRAMVESRDLESDFPGALGIGYIQRVENTDEAVETFITSTRAENAPEFVVTTPPGAGPLPGSVMDERFIIEFIEPVEDNRAAQGLDIGSHPTRREAVERATLTGQGSITGRIDLVQDDQKLPGFLYILPVYAKGMPTATSQERIAATVGWVYMPMVAPPVFDGATQIAEGELDFEVYDGEGPSTDNMIYDDDGHLTTASPGPVDAGRFGDRLFHRLKPLAIGGRTWTVSISTSDQFAAASRGNAWTVGIAGTLLSLLLGIVIFIQGSAASRAQRIAVGMTSDLRRFANAANAATLAKSEFIANMSHEIRTPMTSILGYADLLRSDPEAHASQSKRLEYIDTIKRSGTHLLTILNDILDISKIEAGKLNIEKIETQPTAIVHEVVSLMAVKASASGLTIDAHHMTQVPETILSDPFRLRQILVNLVGNAIKFTHEGAIRIELAFDVQQGRLSCSVIDTGIGMNDEQLGRLFQSFEQADTSTTRQYGGSGLGLMISARLAQILGGGITVESQLGEGSTFTVTVPTGPVQDVKMLPAGPSTIIRASAEELVAEIGDTQAPAQLPLEGMRVLVAEDGIDNQRLISFHLKKAGAIPTIVENGKLAVEALTIDGTPEGAWNPNAPFDMLLTDMQMPEMDGYTAVSLLRGKGCQLPIVALTAHAMSGDHAKCSAAGCDAYASKPIDQAKLVEVCAGYLRKQRQPRKDVA
ncbi:CHASE domain-containing protein [Phycisphaeraceae bacterium D3-23]